MKATKRSLDLGVKLAKRGSKENQIVGEKYHKLG